MRSDGRGPVRPIMIAGNIRPKDTFISSTWISTHKPIIKPITGYSREIVGQRLSCRPIISNSCKWEKHEEDLE